MLNYARIIRLNAIPPREQVRIVQRTPIVATVVPGPFAFEVAVPVQHHAENISSLTFAVERRELGPGCYLVVSHLTDDRLNPPTRDEVGLALSEVVALIALVLPNVIGELLYEGPLGSSHQITYWPAGPLRITTPIPLNHDELGQLLVDHLSRLAQYQPELRGRFRLASRWYLRGREAENPVDKFLYWYIVLEVFPAEGSSDVPRLVQNLLAERVYPSVDPRVIKERLTLGRIAGQRARIVHDGLSHIDLPADPGFAELLRKLEQIVQVVIRIMLDISPGNSLDEWLFPEVSV